MRYPEILLALGLLLSAAFFLIDLSRLPDLALLYAAGHMIWFAAVALLLARVPTLRHKPFALAAPLILLVVLIFGSGIELAQAQVGRNASWRDVGYNLLGAALALMFLVPARRELAQITRRLLQGSLVLLLGLALIAPLQSALDDWRARRDFPLLGGFDSRLELQRWSRGEISHAVPCGGPAALAVTLTTSRFSGTTLQRSLGDWRDHAGLAFRVCNPDAEPLPLTLSIRDGQHFARGTRYADRFNRRFELDTGWNELFIPLEDIRRAPRERELDLADLREVLFFTTNAPRPRSMYLADVRLVTDAPPGASP